MHETIRIRAGTDAGGDLSRRAREALRAGGGGPALLEDWARVLFVHFEADATVLQAQVPFRLDLRAGRAYVSLTAFHSGGLRPAWPEPFARLAAGPAHFPFILNVRTYVRHAGGAGIYFLAEWIPNALAAFVGRRLFGLPFRTGRCRLDHDEVGARGRVEDAHGAGALVYEARWNPAPGFAVAEPDSLAEWLLERYTAFTRLDAGGRFFRVWHPAWAQTEADVVIHDHSLLRSTGPWFETARLIGGHYSPGFLDVHMGRARRLAREDAGVFPAALPQPALGLPLMW